MSKTIKSVEKKKLGTPDMPYGLVGSELWLLPYDERATGSKIGDIVGETDDGYLTVYDRTLFHLSVCYYPKEKVQI